MIIIDTEQPCKVWKHSHTSCVFRLLLRSGFSEEGCVGGGGGGRTV